MTNINVRLPDTSNDYKVRLPDTSDSYLMAIPKIGINLDKVLIIANADVLLSMNIADYYTSKWGLNINHRYNFSLGTDDTVVGGSGGATPQAFYNLITTIAGYIENNAIEAVICSARVPHLVNCIDDGAALKIATSACFGAARFIRDEEGGMVRALSANETIPTYKTQEDGSRWFVVPGNKDYGGSTSKELDNAFFESSRTPVHSILPYGRIGLPKFEAAVPAETELETQRMIDDAFAKTGAGASGGTVHFGYHDRVLPWITGHQSELARQSAVAAGVPAKHYVRSYSANWPAAPAEDYTYADVLAGVLNENAFGLVGSALANQAYNATYKDSYNFLQGAWGYESTSFGNFLVGTILSNGGCAGAGTVQEPFADGVCTIDAFTRNLFLGRSICEAALMSGARHPWMFDVWGDPLYAPYATGSCQNCSASLVPEPNNFDPDTSPEWFRSGSADVDADSVESPGCVVDADLLTIGPLDGDYLSIFLDFGTFTANASVDVRLWMKRVTATGIITLETFNGAGLWSIDLSLLTSNWTFVDENHPAVTVDIAFVADTNGAFDISFKKSGADTQRQFYAWCMYLAEI